MNDTSMPVCIGSTPLSALTSLIMQPHQKKLASITQASITGTRGCVGGSCGALLYAGRRSVYSGATELPRHAQLVEQLHAFLSLSTPEFLLSQPLQTHWYSPPQGQASTEILAVYHVKSQTNLLMK